MKGKYFFLVVFFNKNKRLLVSLAVLAAIVAAAWLIVMFTNFLVTVTQDQSLPYTVLVYDPYWQGQAQDAQLPRFFVAGGPSYDRRILVEGWGLAANTLVTVDYMEELGLHILYGEVERITYSDRRLQVYIRETEAGYTMISVAKGLLEEGELQIVFSDLKGVPLRYEEEFIYSLPVAYTPLATGNTDAKAQVFAEVIAGEVPAGTGLDQAVLTQYADRLLLYVHGAKISTVQKSGAMIRVYVTPQPVFEVVALETGRLETGNNTLRLIDSNDLSNLWEINFLITN